MNLTNYQKTLYKQWVDSLPPRDRDEDSECCCGTGDTTYIEFTPSGIGDQFKIKKRIGSYMYSIDLEMWDDGTCGHRTVTKID